MEYYGFEGFGSLPRPLTSKMCMKLKFVFIPASCSSIPKTQKNGFRIFLGNGTPPIGPKMCKKSRFFYAGIVILDTENAKKRVSGFFGHRTPLLHPKMCKKSRFFYAGIVILDTQNAKNGFRFFLDTGPPGQKCAKNRNFLCRIRVPRYSKRPESWFSTVLGLRFGE